MARLAVLASGSGTNLEAILREGLPVDLVLADRDCHALAIARDARVPTALIDRRDFGYRSRTEWNRAGFTSAVTTALHHSRITLVAMAGFMTIFAPSIFDEFPGPILNTHPSLLPSYKGGHAVADALAAHATQAGCSIHLVTPELDSGTVIAQAKVPVLPNDTVGTLHERIKNAEHRLYPAVISAFLEP